ncbi:hypothetical protein VNO77_16389 [Canavalia gladiata]|uniref:Uncharacterized protein n=1 Tax=Canavalia gladiata TaxID=3824 RepID=A0AAN9M5F3_CANGL
MFKLSTQLIGIFKSDFLFSKSNERSFLKRFLHNLNMGRQAESVAVTKCARERLFKLLNMYKIIRDLTLKVENLVPEECIRELNIETTSTKYRISGTDGASFPVKMSVALLPKLATKATILICCCWYCVLVWCIGA